MFKMREASCERLPYIKVDGGSGRHCVFFFRGSWVTAGGGSRVR